MPVKTSIYFGIKPNHNLKPLKSDICFLNALVSFVACSMFICEDSDELPLACNHTYLSTPWTICDPLEGFIIHMTVYILSSLGLSITCDNRPSSGDYHF